MAETYQIPNKQDQLVFKRAIQTEGVEGTRFLPGFFSFVVGGARVGGEGGKKGMENRVGWTWLDKTHEFGTVNDEISALE